jgi:hypothetical protein
MLLGIAYHAALSFSLGAGWVVQDPRQSKALYIFQAFVHGFRMQLFMLVSGFFTAMLWRKRGLKALLLNRFRRVLLPCAVGLVTVVPAIHWAGSVAIRLQPPLSEYAAWDDASLAAISRGMGSGWSVTVEQGLSMERMWAIGQSPLPVDTPSCGERGNWRQFPAFILLWFLWFLVLLLPGFSIFAIAAERFGWRIYPHALIASQGCLVWVVPLTCIPVCWMGNGGNDFGPDTSMGILPLPHVLGYYAIFFGFGVLYFECDDAVGRMGRMGRCWRWTLPVAVLLIFPLGLEFASGVFGLRDFLAPAGYHRRLSIIFQALYPWMMSFALIGGFRALFLRETHWIRYLSDSAYWFYLMHLPLVILAQAVVCRWGFSALLKFFLICGVVSAVLFVSYAKCVRHTFVGAFLNGSRSGRA